MGDPFSKLTVPQFSTPIPFYISHSHMSYRHNPYHLTHVTYQTCSADETFPKCPIEFHPKPISKIRENLPMKFGSCRSSHMIFLQCVPLTHSSNSQTVSHYLILQSNWSFHNQAMTSAIKFNKNFAILSITEIDLLNCGSLVSSITMPIIIFMLTIITWIPTYHASLLTQSYASQ